MICTLCRRPIRRTEAARAHVIKDEKGRVVETLHNKCKHIRDKRARMGEGGKRSQDSPTAYVEALRYRNRDDLDAETQAAVELAEQRYRELLAKVEDGAASEDDRELLDALAVARDGEKLDFAQIELSSAEAKARAANAAVQEERKKEAAPNAWSDWRIEESSPPE